MAKSSLLKVLPYIWMLGKIQAFQTKNSRRRISLLSKRNEELESSNKTVCIVGGGWAGFSAADALSSATESISGRACLSVELLDASPRGQGGLAGGWRTKNLKLPVEAGLHGFWREYQNTFAAIERIGLDIDEILTPYTPSILVSQSGRVALAPVLGNEDEESDINKDFSLEDVDWKQSSSVIKTLASFLPPPLDIAILSEFNDKSPLTIADRISAIGLLGVWSDFQQEDPDSWKRYDKISADTLFRSIAGVSPTLYQELVSPLLHVLPMTPGYDCSAAAALSCFHVFALQARGAFDVRWCKGTISELIFNPWAEKLQAGGNVNIRGGSKVTAIKEIKQDDNTVRYEVQVNGEESMEYDAVVLAVGGTAMKNLLSCSPPLANLPGASGWKKFRGVTCCAVRLFLKPSLSKEGKVSGIPAIERAMKDSPIVVCGPNVGGIPELTETGFCIYDLQRLHEEFDLERQNNDEVETPCIAFEIDFFRANELTKIQDDMEVAALALNALESALDIPPIDPGLILDVSVVRANNAVSHFCVDSASWSPQVKLNKQLYICGDWIDRTGHASWSTEKAVVTARQAAGALSKDFGFNCDTEILPAASDSPQLSTLRQIAKVLRRATSFDLLPSSPWVFAKQLFGGRL